jgi:CheY-like chemotaxis protein
MMSHRFKAIITRHATNNYQLSTIHYRLRRIPFSFDMNLRPKYFSPSGGCRLNTLPRVLIVDESADSRDVLRTLLERYGASTLDAPRLEQAVELTESFRPHLIVLDAESDHSAAGTSTNALRNAADKSGTPIVILGTVGPGSGTTAAGQFIAKPYHYGQLLRKIESLLAAA